MTEENDTGEQIRDEQETKPTKRRHTPITRILAIIGVLAASILAIIGGTIGYLYVSTPLSIREPLYEHYHFRMQVIVNGKAENFAEATYQEGYSKDNCNAALTTHPIHFHDDKDQFVHIHWEGLTGGQVLKYYGWNLIGGTRGSLGYRFDSFPKLQKVPIHGNNLPAIPNDATFYVYTGDEHGYKQRTMDDFKDMDLEKFFGKMSNSPAHELNKKKRQGLAALWGKIEPTAYAHDIEDGHTTETSSTLDQDQLKYLNNLIGNVVIFVQRDKPTDSQIKDKFNHLEPLSESTCAG